MTPTAPDNRLYVVVGVLVDDAGNVLIQQRRPGTPRAGQWEFPGGKLEPGESAVAALARELAEELGIRVDHAEFLAVVTHDYDHARVWLDTYMVRDFSGEAVGREGQELAWVPTSAVTDYDILEAVHPILDALERHQEVRR